MEVTVEDVMNLPSARNCRLVAGKLGLCKTVRWFLGMLSPVVEPWVHEHEILFIYGHGLDTSESALTFLLEQCAIKEVSAIFFIVGPIIKEIPETVRTRADELSLPLIEMPNDMPVVDITKEIAELIMNSHRIFDEKGLILKNFIFGHESDYEKYRKQLTQYTDWIVVDKPMNIICVRMPTTQLWLNSSNLAYLEQIILNAFGKILYFLDGEQEVVLLVNNISGNVSQLVAKCESLIEAFVKVIKTPNPRIGIGRTVQDIMQVTESYKTALKALDIDDEGSPAVQSYDEMSNIEKLLVEIQSEQVLVNCFQNTIGKLLEYDKEHDADLFNTLRVYLEQEGNISKSAQALFIHRNTMVYRINKMNGILGMEIDTSKAERELEVAIRCYDRYIVRHAQ
ncbi:MAG: PucR family transcriptional regulator ligand-binding domain-containing protein [Clostridiales bacterium]|nr:PucR family transcriptional regulator ligand-binding domain-containing protein [Clostridiales bacterium]